MSGIIPGKPGFDTQVTLTVQVKELEKGRESSHTGSTTTSGVDSAHRTSTAPGNLLEEDQGITGQESSNSGLARPYLASLKELPSNTSFESTPAYVADEGGMMDVDFFKQHVAYSLARESLGSLQSLGLRQRHSTVPSPATKSVTFADKVVANLSTGVSHVAGVHQMESTTQYQPEMVITTGVLIRFRSI